MLPEWSKAPAQLEAAHAKVNARNCEDMRKCVCVRITLKNSASAMPMPTYPELLKQSRQKLAAGAWVMYDITCDGHLHMPPSLYVPLC